MREVPLSGLDDVTGLRLRITEIPATDAVPASLRIEVVDFTARGGPVLLPDVPVAVREGGGFTATGPRGGVRWQFDALGQLEHRELPLSGTDFALRFTDDALDPMPVVGRGGVPVPGASVTAVRNATGALSELTVRVPMPGTDGLPAVWRFEPGGLLRQQEQPITLPGLDGSSGLGIKVTVTPGAGGTTTRVVELTGPQHLTGALRLTSVDSTLSGRLPNGFTVTDTLTHSRFHLDADRRLVLRDLPDRDGSGFLRFTEDSAPGTAPVRLADLGGLPQGSPWTTWRGSPAVRSTRRAPCRDLRTNSDASPARRRRASVHSRSSTTSARRNGPSSTTSGPGWSKTYAPSPPTNSTAS